MYPVRSINQILDAATDKVKLRFREENRGREKYLKRMRNRERIRKKR